MSTKYVQFSDGRYTHNIAVVETEDGHKWVALKHLCEIFSLTWQPQHAKLKATGRFNCHDIVIVAVDGKSREMTCLQLSHVEGWVNDVNVNKVKPERREALRAFQANCARILHAAYNPSSSAEGLEAGLLQQLSTKVHDVQAQITAVQSDLEDLQQFVELFVGSDDAVVLKKLIKEVADFEGVSKSAVIGRLRATFGTAGVYKSHLAKLMINHLNNILGRGLHLVKP